MTTASPAQSEQANTNILKHRIDTSDLASAMDVADSILDMTDRAKGILDLLSFQFVDKDSNIAANHIVFASLTAAIAEIEDIKATINAHFDAVRAKGAE